MVGQRVDGAAREIPTLALVHHGLPGIGASDVLLASHPRSVFSKHRGVRRRSGVCVVHSALNATS